MSNVIMVEVPESIEKYANLLGVFFSGMMYKLDKNSHKDTPTVASIPRIVDLLRGEIAEFEEQFFDNKDDENTLIELMDTANFAFLAYVALRLQGVNHERDSDKVRQG